MTSRAAWPVRRLGSAAVGTALLGIAAWLALRNLSLPTHDGWMFWVPVTLWLVTMGLLWWCAALGSRAPRSRARLRASWRAGWGVGMAGLGVGFVGPLVLDPEASLGPLLGILITGPIGFVVGALGGAVSRTTAEATE
ncbi:MAG TPA: hypothetical protein VJQ44_18820 [Gemmatimonadales bacterium]|nr:hypothetical protein [Gemmatimonadales bacterium]